MRYLPVVLLVAFTVYCVFDVIGSDERTRRGVPVPAWLLLVVLLPFFGGVAWLLVSRWSPRGPGGGRPRPGPVAPDDDPEFLRRLAEEARRRAQREGRDGADDTTPPA